MEIIEQCFLVLAYIAVIGFLISGLDDLFFDSHFLLYLFRNRGKRPVTLSQLKGAPEQWTAVFVPAWREGGIVNRMAEYAARVLLYEKYDIFVGVYPNDPETVACLDRVRVTHPRIHKVVVPHYGPTSKADCLNWIYRAMRLNEAPGVREYKLIALHDAEDVLHPLVLKVYNYFVPRLYDMGQVPVFALEHPVWKYWTANTYIDDFSELHTKDLFVRESLGGVVPSAGVGTCFTRDSIDMLAAENGGDPFRIGNLTEDYEVGIRIKRAGLRTGVINVPVERIVRPHKPGGMFGPPRTVTEIVAVREAFPSTFCAAVRQRTRWILGISFQTWEQTGWAGTAAMRYTLLRDRRAPLTHLLNMAGYLTLGFVVFQWLFGYSPWAERFYLRPLFTADSIFWKIVIVDTWLLAYRALQKFISVKCVYNLKQACFSIPRVVLSNFINFIATIRALYLYLTSKLFHHPIVWHKTAHVFPGEAELREYAKTIEDLLVEQGLVTREQIFEALKTESGGSAPLCLLRLGLLDEEQFTGIWARHSGLPVRRLHPALLPLPILRRFPEAHSKQCQALPLEITNAHLVIAFREPPAPIQLRQLTRQLGQPVQPVLTWPSSLDYARDRAYPNLVLPLSPLHNWIDRLRQAAGLPAPAIEECLADQQRTRKNLADILVDRGRLQESQARQLWAQQLGLPPASAPSPILDQVTLDAAGPAFWWLHRLVPLAGNAILIAAPLQPRLGSWLAGRLGRTPVFQAELPSRLESIARHLKAWVDPDQALLECLVHQGVLPAAEMPNLRARLGLLTDPVHRWLLLEKRATEKQLHQAFLDLGGLLAAEPWRADMVRQLAPALPPGFSTEHGCYCLDYQNGVRLGLAQWPSRQVWRTIHERLEGHPLWFQPLTLEEAQVLRDI
jgi:adsorption protein B